MKFNNKNIVLTSNFIKLNADNKCLKALSLLKEYEYKNQSITKKSVYFYINIDKKTFWHGGSCVNFEKWSGDYQEIIFSDLEEILKGNYKLK